MRIESKNLTRLINAAIGLFKDTGEGKDDLTKILVMAFETVRHREEIFKNAAETRSELVGDVAVYKVAEAMALVRTAIRHRHGEKRSFTVIPGGGQ